MNKPDTREVILDAAESLFAKNGYHGSSIRAITNEAGVNIASVNYHFGSKEELIRAVLERRFVPINRGREEKLRTVLDKAHAGNKSPRLRDIIIAFVEPGLDGFENTESICNLMSIVTTALARRDSKVSNIVHEIMMPVFMQFQDALRKALPGSSDTEVMLKMHFMIGTFLHAIRFSQMEGIPPEMKGTIDSKTLRDMIVKFIEAGMKAK